MRAITSLTIAGCLAGCGNASQQGATTVPSLCSKDTAKAAAMAVITPLMSKIAEPQSRAQGCTEMNVVLKDSGSRSYDKFKSPDCEWDFGGASPYEQAKLMLTSHRGELSTLCYEAHEDAKRTNQQGEGFLRDLPPDEK
jgi:hypothetical protein